MTTQHAIPFGHQISEVVSTLRLEGEYLFFTQNKIEKETACAFRDAQVAGKRVLQKLSRRYGTGKTDEEKAVKTELGNLINFEIAQLKQSMSKNFNLSEHDFLELVNRLKRGDNSLFEKVFLTHFESCVSFLEKKFFISRDEAYDASMDALMLFRQKILDDKVKYGNIRFLFTQMASQLHIKSKNKLNKESDIIDRSIEEEEEVDDFSLDILEKSWQDLGEGCKELLTKIFYGNMKLTEIASEEQKSDFTIRKQKQRCVDRIRTLFQKNISQSL